MGSLFMMVEVGAMVAAVLKVISVAILAASIGEKLFNFYMYSISQCT